MGILDRVVLSLYALAFTVMSLFTLLVTFGWEAPARWFQDTMMSSQGRTTVGVVSSLIVLAGIRFIYYAFKRVPDQAVIHDGEMGEVRISLVAVKSLVTVASKIPGVRGKDAVFLSKGGTGISVALDVKAALDANLPIRQDSEATATYVRDIVGVTVDSVKVAVSDIALDPGARRYFRMSQVWERPQYIRDYPQVVGTTLGLLCGVCLISLGLEDTGLGTFGFLGYSIGKWTDDEGRGIKGSWKKSLET